MSTAARKARKRLQRDLRLFDQHEVAAQLWSPTEKKPTMRYGDRKAKGLGLMSSPEFMARMLAISRSMWETKSLR